MYRPTAFQSQNIPYQDQYQGPPRNGPIRTNGSKDVKVVDVTDTGFQGVMVLISPFTFFILLCVPSILGTKTLVFAEEHAEFAFEHYCLGTSTKRRIPYDHIENIRSVNTCCFVGLSTNLTGTIFPGSGNDSRMVDKLLSEFRSRVSKASGFQWNARMHKTPISGGDVESLRSEIRELRSEMRDMFDYIKQSQNMRR